jgi:Fe-S oxidoreductase
LSSEGDGIAPAKPAGRIPGTTIVDPDAGCCGMAGSFGYMRGHFDVAGIGERRLMPAAARSGPTT